MGGERPRVTPPIAPRPSRHTRAPLFRHSCAPPRHSCAGRNPPQHPHPPPPPNLPPSRGEVRWGVRGHESTPPIAPRPAPSHPRPSRHTHTPLRHTHAPPVTSGPSLPSPPRLSPSHLRLSPSHLRLSPSTCAPPRHSCAGRNPTPPNRATIPSEERKCEQCPPPRPPPTPAPQAQPSTLNTP